MHQRSVEDHVSFYESILVQETDPVLYMLDLAEAFEL